jgi:murein L,D-transpeptidase YcbB/YkuD
MRKYLLIAFCIAIYFSCKNKAEKVVAADTTITVHTSFNNLFLDSIQLENFLTKHNEFKPFEQQYLEFYKQRNYEYAWFDTSGLAEQSHNFINLLSSSIDELRDSSLYNNYLFNQYNQITNNTIHNETKDEILKTELFFTGQFFVYASKMYKGSDIDAKQLGWLIPRKKIDLTALLDSTIKTKAKETDSYVPLNSQYKKLQEQLTKYLKLDDVPWDSIAKPAKPLKKNDSSIIITKIKQRLFVLGDMSSSDTSAKYDSIFLKAVKLFQSRMGLATDGAIGSKMIDELNIPIKQRIQQLLINIERSRWLPPERDTNYIVVNIPEYKMHVFDSSKNKFDINVIVGRAADSTVIFNGRLRYIVFSPYWNVPVSIVKKEIVPAINRDKNYISRNNMEITGYSGSIPIVRQKPGPSNSLGLVKFLFPNNHNIYFHDTNVKELFGQNARSLSHGCIRLSEPKKLAAYLLRNDSTWTDRKIDSCMHLDKEKWVTLTKPVPVFIIYLTAWVDRSGLLNFRKDIYHHDKRMADKLFVK